MIYVVTPVLVMDTQKMETQKKEIAVVVLNWNGVSLLEKFLPTLIKYSPHGRYIYY